MFMQVSERIMVDRITGEGLCSLSGGVYPGRFGL